MSWYPLIKQIHLTSIVLSLALFLLRGAWMFADSPRLRARWVKVLPHIVDSVLLGSAIILAILLRQYPFVHGWLTAKVLALLLYIVLGTIALKRGRTKPQRAMAFVAALITFAYIVRTAILHHPWPFV